MEIEGKGSGNFYVDEACWDPAFELAHNVTMPTHHEAQMIERVISSGTPLIRQAYEQTQSMQQPSYTLAASGAAFDKTDLLKARGYEWNADSKFWHARIFGADTARAEARWLADEVYGGHLPGDHSQAWRGRSLFGTCGRNNPIVDRNLI